MNNSYVELFKSFQKLWLNRSFDKSKDPYFLIQTTISIDLLDELTHPRARSSPRKKFEQAVNRIRTSSIPIEDKRQLINLYERALAKLEKSNE